MRRPEAALALMLLLVSACAGGGARYGCPAEAGYSCESVSEVYSEVARGGADFAGRGEKSPGKRFPEGGPLHSGESGRSGAGGGADASSGAGAMPVYVPPRVIRILVAPWQDTEGVFHGEKYIYALPGRGRWTLRGASVPLGGPEDGGAGNLRLRGNRR